MRVLILPSGENAEQFLIDPAAAVEPLVDDQRLLRPVGRQVELELAQRRRVHRADVQVADLAVAQLRHHVAAVVDPSRVLQIGEGLAGGRLTVTSHAPSLAGLSLTRKWNLVPAASVKERQ